VTNQDDEQPNENCSSSSSLANTLAKPLKKRWLAHHTVDQEQQLNHVNGRGNEVAASRIGSTRSLAVDR
jgi:hypothetical protein